MKGEKLITIDGPSASGKSTVSRLVASQLGWKWVSTGAFYRGLGYASIKKGLGVSDEAELTQLANSQDWTVEMEADRTKVTFMGEDVTGEIQGEDVGARASKISTLPEVRKALLQRQRDCYLFKNGLVAEGRDCGTVVFPQAPAKIYLTASPELRAARRSEQDKVSTEKTREMVEKRDAQDSGRKVAPLKMADGALHIDSSFLSLNEVVDEVLNYARSQGIS